MPGKRPSAVWLVTEPARSVAEFGVFAVTTPVLARAPRGDGHTVLILPGLLAADTSTVVLRRFLDRLGYTTSGWGLGRNTGPTRAVLDGLPSLLGQLSRASGGPVSIIGWSLGGLFARGLAVGYPDLVRQVITLGSPYAAAGSGQTYADAAYRFLSRKHAPQVRGTGRKQPFADPLSVPATSVYTKQDGIVAWHVCREEVGEQRESVGIPGSHLGLGHNPAALWLIADRLAQPSDEWRPFTPPRRLASLFSVDPASARGVERGEPAQRHTP